MKSAADAASPSDAWTIARILSWTQSYFAGRGLPQARLDAEVLLAFVLQKDRLYLYTHYDQPLSPAERQQLRALVQRRARREPVAYIRGEREFYGRSFLVGPDVLIPRPETEHVVEWALAVQLKLACAAPMLLDVGTGSGALAVTLAAELPTAAVVATDLSPAALAVAARNAARHGVAERIHFGAGDLFAPLKAAGQTLFDIIVANPPYVETGVLAQLDADVRDYEPHTALFAGPDGLAILRRLCADVTRFLRTPGAFICEIGAAQGAAVRRLLEAHGPWSSIDVHRDLQGHDRVVVACT